MIIHKILGEVKKNEKIEYKRLYLHCKFIVDGYTIRTMFFFK